MRRTTIIAVLALLLTVGVTAMGESTADAAPRAKLTISMMKKRTNAEMALWCHRMANPVTGEECEDWGVESSIRSDGKSRSNCWIYSLERYDDGWCDGWMRLWIPEIGNPEGGYDLFCERKVIVWIRRNLKSPTGWMLYSRLNRAYICTRSSAMG